MGRYASGSKHAVCKTAGVTLHRFESCPAHVNTQPDYFTRVYTPTRAKLAHLLPPGDTTALCGRSLWGVQSSDWGGTGSQEEYDKAAALPLCSRCEYRSRETL